MIELRSKHYKFLRRDITRKLYDKAKSLSNRVGVDTSNLSICGYNFTIFSFIKYNKAKKIISRKTYVEYNPQDYHLIKNVIKLEQLYNVPLIGEGLST